MQLKHCRADLAGHDVEVVHGRVEATAQISVELSEHRLEVHRCGDDPTDHEIVQVSSDTFVIGHEVGHRTDLEAFDDVQSETGHLRDVADECRETRRGSIA